MHSFYNRLCSLSAEGKTGNVTKPGTKLTRSSEIMGVRCEINNQKVPLQGQGRISDQKHLQPVSKTPELTP
jgi:hypothetical protein